MRRETSPSVMFLLSAGSSADLVSLSRLWFPHRTVFAPTSSLTIEIHSHRRAFWDVFFISIKGFRASGVSCGKHSIASAPFDPDMFSSCLYLGFCRQQKVSNAKCIGGESISFHLRYVTRRRRHIHMEYICYVLPGAQRGHLVGGCTRCWATAFDVLTARWETLLSVDQK